jgi:hypothetical protein
MVTAIQFGFDLEVLYLRMDLSRPAAAALAEGLELAVSFRTPAGTRAAKTQDLDGRDSARCAFKSAKASRQGCVLNSSRRVEQAWRRPAAEGRRNQREPRKERIVRFRRVLR